MLDAHGPLNRRERTVLVHRLIMSFLIGSNMTEREARAEIAECLDTLPPIPTDEIEGARQVVDSLKGLSVWELSDLRASLREGRGP